MQALAYPFGNQADLPNLISESILQIVNLAGHAMMFISAYKVSQKQYH